MGSARSVLDRLVASSPVVRVQLPRGERERVVPLTVVQVQALADAMPTRNRAMVIAQVGLGLRIGELLALRVEDVDFLHRHVRIEWQIAPGTQLRAAPKTPRSRRTIPLPQVVADALAAHIAEFPPGADGSIFTSTVGAVYWQEVYASRLFPAAVKRAGLLSGRRHTISATTTRACSWRPVSPSSRSPNGWATRTPRSC